MEAKPSSRGFGLTMLAIVVIVVASALAVWLLTAPRLAPVKPPPQSPVIGLWKKPKLIPGKTGFVDIRADGTLTSITVDDATGAKTQEQAITWWMENDFLVFRYPESNPWGKLRTLLLHIGPTEERMDVISVDENELVLGPAHDRTILNRSKNLKGED